jgi:predicted acyl esterase
MKQSQPTHDIRFLFDLKSPARDGTNLSTDVFLPTGGPVPGHLFANFPRFDRNFNTGGDIATGTTWQIARQTIFHNSRYPSHILLPIIPA